jgi:hypothetical protein
MEEQCPLRGNQDTSEAEEAKALFRTPNFRILRWAYSSRGSGPSIQINRTVYYIKLTLNQSHFESYENAPFT